LYEFFESGISYVLEKGYFDCFFCFMLVCGGKKIE